MSNRAKGSARWIVGLALAATTMAACADIDEGADEPALPRGLVLESSASVLEGSYADDEHALRFRSEVGEAGFEVEVVCNGMTIRAAMDEAGLLEHEGYATDSGEPTQMGDEDRAALTRLVEVLEAEGAEATPPLERLRGFASVWSEYPSTKELDGLVATGLRSYTSICWALGSYVQVTHDDASYSDWADQTTYNAWMSMEGPGPCSDGTWFWNNNAWQCFEPNHSSTIEYAYGACFGRCGAGCGSDTQFTWDCADHDSCVRFGHDTASLWCDDEFSSTVDDWASAPDCL
jgi:hypothetical protein